MTIEVDFLVKTIEDKIVEAFPALGPNQKRLSPNLFSPFRLSLPRAQFDKVISIIQSFYRLRDAPEYQQFLRPLAQEKEIIDPGNKSVLMGFDFHIMDSGQIKLIEINTNASQMIFGYFHYRAQNLELPVLDFSLSEISKMVLAELSFQGKKISQPKIAIVDEVPEQQKLYFEFQIFSELFKAQGWKTEILDIAQVNPKDFDFVYNRSTDFFLKDPQVKKLKQAFNQKSICLSPNPYEYLALADKQRLIDFSARDFFEQLNFNSGAKKLIQEAVPFSQELLPENKDQIWANRKKLFFKPKNSFGSKQTYRGESVRNRIFEEIFHSDFLAQEYCPAAELDFQAGPLKARLKYDLRFFVYDGRVQMVVARLYQGQVTNSQTPLGGLAPVLIV